MRKRVTGSNFHGAPSRNESWLDLEELAQVEVTSEDPAFPIESALALGTGRSWHASDPGEQTILLMFNQPQRLRRICLRFVDMNCDGRFASRESAVAPWHSFVSPPVRINPSSPW